MEFKIKNNCNLTEIEIENIYSFFENLKNYLKNEKIIINISKVQNKYKVITKLNHNGIYFKSETVNKDYYDALEKNSNILKHEIVQYQKKHNYKTINKHSLKEDKVEKVAKIKKKEIISRKKINIDEMSEKEAIKQMEFLKHNSFMFFNLNTNSYCMLYQKNDNKYGLLIS